jgi:hypothetical protein
MQKERILSNQSSAGVVKTDVRRGKDVCKVHTMDTDKVCIIVHNTHAEAFNPSPDLVINCAVHASCLAYALMNFPTAVHKYAFHYEMQATLTLSSCTARTIFST